MKIIIQSNGCIDLQFLKVIGFSTKRNDNTKFGQFGSGIKYALALLLRKGIKFHLYNGTKPVDISTEEIEMYSDRGVHTTDCITINGINTNISTDIGPDWEPWMILRELVSNAKDQDFNANIYTEADDYIVQMDDNSLTWVIYTGAGDTYDLVSSLHNVYVDTWLFKGGRHKYNLCKTEKAKVYYQGFYAGDIKEYPAMFNIDATNSISIDERRIYNHLPSYHYLEDLFELKDKLLIKQFIHRFTMPDTYEYNKINGLCTPNFSAEFIQVLNSLKIQPINLKNIEEVLGGPDADVLYVCSAFYSVISSVYDSDTNVQDDKIYRPVDINLVSIELRRLVEQARDIIASEFGNIFMFDITYAKIKSMNTDSVIWGLADRSKNLIVINSEIESRSDKLNLPFITGLLLEEFMHLDFNVEDCSRHFQDILLFNLSKLLISKHQLA